MPTYSGYGVSRVGSGQCFSTAFDFSFALDGRQLSDRNQTVFSSGYTTRSGPISAETIAALADGAHTFDVVINVRVSDVSIASAEPKIVATAKVAHSTKWTLLPADAPRPADETARGILQPVH